MNIAQTSGTQVQIDLQDEIPDYPENEGQHAANFQKAEDYC